MSQEKESGKQRSAHHAYGQSNSSSPSSTDAATFVHTEYPRTGESGEGIDAVKRQQTPPWYQEHGKCNDGFLIDKHLLGIHLLIDTSKTGAPIDQDPARHAENELDFERHTQKFLWSRIRHTLRDPFAEFLGCFVLIIFGDGSVAQVLLSSNPNLPKGSQDKGAYQSISWG